jgi:molecular chaperone HscB
MPDALTCWNCGGTGERSHFCASCHSIQPPSTDYFEFFGLPRKLNIDPAELEKRYYALSRRLHPDVYFRRSARERQLSLDASAILNDAYRTLKDPAARAEYLLRAEGLTIGESVSPDLIQEVFGYNMALEEEGPEKLQEIRRSFEALVEESGRELQVAIIQYDAEAAREVLARIAAVLGRRRFLLRLLAQSG